MWLMQLLAFFQGKSFRPRAVANMAAKPANAEVKLKTFSCSLCHFALNYHYYGSKPSFTKSLMLLEDCYIMKDPFSATGGSVVLGGTCSHCGCCVCMDNNCSLFYSKRFCIPCALQQLDHFPVEIQQEVGRQQQK